MMYCIKGGFGSNDPSSSEFARALHDDQIESPSVHMARMGCGTWMDRAEFPTPYLWYEAAVRDILEKTEYMGHTVNFRSHRESYKDRRTVHHSPGQALHHA